MFVMLVSVLLITAGGLLVLLARVTSLVTVRMTTLQVGCVVPGLFRLNFDIEVQISFVPFVRRAVVLSFSCVTMLGWKPLIIMLVWLVRCCVSVRLLGVCRLSMTDCPLWPMARNSVSLLLWKGLIR